MPLVDLIEPAATGRSKCRSCQQKIDKGALRFGERVPNPFGDGEGETTYWFHLICAADERPEKLAALLAGHAAELPERALIEQTIAWSLASPKLSQAKWAERAPTGRARCQECREPIEKDALRVAEQREAEVMVMATTSYVHAGCAKRRYGAAGLVEKLRRTSKKLAAVELEELERALL